jgi:hypothetical protein
MRHPNPLADQRGLWRQVQLQIARYAVKSGANMRFLLTLPLLAIGCGPTPTIVDGTVSGASIGTAGTAFWGGRYLIFVDKALDCLDVSFVNHTYSEGADFGDTDFSALQFTFSRGTDVFPGNFSVQGAAEVTAKFLDYRDGVFDADDEVRGREGTLFVDKVADKDVASGEFDIDFGEDQILSGSFSAEWCVNLPD